MKEIANSSNIKSKENPRRNSPSMPKLFSIQPVWREKLWSLKEQRTIYSQGDAAKSVMYLQSRRRKAVRRQ